jgi:hypothetical protein
MAEANYSPLLAMILRHRGQVSWLAVHCRMLGGLLNMLLLHGDGLFQQHWFYWTGIKIYATANSGSWILECENYLLILLCMLVADVLGTLKCSVLQLLGEFWKDSP